LEYTQQPRSAGNVATRPRRAIDSPPRFPHLRDAAFAAPLLTMTRMQRPEIVDALKDLLRQQKQLKIDVESIGEETRLSQVGFDSISILDFIYDVESRFNVRTEIADLVRMEQVKDLINHLEGKVAG
jgi:acyl carrier protein